MKSTRKSAFFMGWNCVTIHSKFIRILAQKKVNLYKFKLLTMKTLLDIRKGLLAFMASLLFLSCASQYSNHGTSSDRTGTNGATNGTGKPPRTTAHNQR